MSKSDMGLVVETVVRDAGRAGEVHQDAHKERLRAWVRDDGFFKDPIEVCDWGKKGQLILDGHTRYEIWLEEPEDSKLKKPRIKIVPSVKTLPQAEMYALLVATLRRNLPHEKMLKNNRRLLALDYNITKLVQETGIGRSTLEREKAISKLPQNVQDALDSGEIKIPKAKIPGLVASGDWKMAVANCFAGRKWNDDGKESEEPPFEPVPEPDSDESIDNAVDNIVTEEGTGKKLSQAVKTMKRDLEAITKQLSPQILERAVKSCRVIHPGSVPKSGGFPIDNISRWVAQISGAVESWIPVEPCDNCDSGCSTCNGRGWARKGTGR